jgi:hypothetical protein
MISALPLWYQILRTSILHASPIAQDIAISRASPSILLPETIQAKKILFSRGRNLYSYLFPTPSANYLEGSLESPSFVALPGEVSAFPCHLYTPIMIIR